MHYILICKHVVQYNRKECVQYIAQIEPFLSLQYFAIFFPALVTLKQFLATLSLQKFIAREGGWQHGARLASIHEPIV